MFTVTFEGLDDLERQWDRAVASTLIDELRAAVARVSSMAATEAKQTHRYNDQSGDLTRSIVVLPTILTRWTISGGIRAGAKYASYVEGGTKPHDILPKTLGGTLSFSVGGRQVFTKKVHHPGTKPHPFMGQAYFRAERALPIECEKACEKFAEVMNRE
jgi:hypothetical protein